MYKILRELLEAGYEVNFRPIKGHKVTLTVQEAKNGKVEAVEVDLIDMEWALVEQGITDRLLEAKRRLKIT